MTSQTNQKVQELIDGLRHQIKVLEAENNAIKSRRNTLMNENAQMQRQINYWRKKVKEVQK